MVSCAADALFVNLDRAGLLGESVDNRLAGYMSDGLQVGGWRQHPARERPPRQCASIAI